jgi:hypothetical protein
VSCQAQKGCVFVLTNISCCSFPLSTGLASMEMSERPYKATPTSSSHLRMLRLRHPGESALP